MDCRVCRNKKFRKLLFFHETSKAGSISYPLYQCTGCKLIQPYPQPYTASTKSQVYAKKGITKCYLNQEERIDFSSRDYQDYFRNFISFEQSIKAYQIQGKHLDIGCGSGHLLVLGRNLNLDSEGTELSPGLINQLQKAGFKVYNKEVDEFKEESYDLVTMNHVLEHIDNLQEFTKSVNKILKPKGYLMVAFPYIYGIIPRILRTRWYGQGYGQHLNFFSIKSITTLLTSNNFEIIRIKQLSLDYSPIWLPGPIKIITHLVSKITILLGAGDNLFVIARKL